MRGLESYLIVLAACVSLSLAQKKGTLGIGFSLTTDYGVASAYFLNGTTIDIAKVEGSFQYKEYLRTLRESDIPVDIFPDPPPPFACGTPSVLASAESLFPWDYYKHWWFGGSKFGGGKPVSAFEPMFSSLKAATEAVLGTDIEAVLVTMSHWPRFDDGFDETVQHEIGRALNAVGLERWHRMESNNAAALHAYMDPQYCDYRTYGVLTVEYTRSALSMHLWYFDDCICELSRDFYSAEVGHVALERCHAIGGTEDCDEQLFTALRQMITMPASFGRGELKMLDFVVVSGEAGASPRLNTILQEVLQERDETRNASILPLAHYLDLPFIASRQVAIGALRAQYDYDMPKPPPQFEL